MAPKAKARYAVAFEARHTFSLLTRCSTIIVRLISTAQTGFFYTMQRVRQGPSLAAVKYDPKGEW